LNIFSPSQEAQPLSGAFALKTGAFCVMMVKMRNPGFCPKSLHKTVSRSIFMEKIASFTIDHIKLQPGLYVSRKDKIGAETVTTFDLRLTKPNDEPVMNTAEVHTIEHLAATFLRNDPQWKDSVVYFGPTHVTRRYNDLLHIHQPSSHIHVFSNQFLHSFYCMLEVAVFVKKKHLFRDAFCFISIFSFVYKF
jgi:hypothetical protein